MKYTPLKLVFLLAPLVFSFAVGQDIFIPEVPKLTTLFHTTPGLVQLTLSLFMLAVGIGQLIIGPLSDRFGRKSIVLLSIALYTVGSLAAVLIESIDVLIFARILQGFGACGMMVCAFAIVRDLSEGNESAQIYSYLNGAIAISPLLAPLAGGYLDVSFGWRAPFFFLAALGVAIFIAIALLLSESIKEKNKNASLTGSFRDYMRVIKNRQFFTFNFISASALASFFTFFSVSPYILINLLHVSETHFGYYFAIIGIMFFIGSIGAGKLSLTLGINKVALVGSMLFFLSGVIMLLWTLLIGTSLWSFLIPTALAGIGGAFMMGAGAGGALEPFPDIAGTAAALLGASEFLLAALVGTVALLRPVTSNMPLAIVLTLFGGLAVLLVFPYNKMAAARKEAL
jgi:Bcr/CflA subfamily drug resistance transporter